MLLDSDVEATDAAMAEKELVAKAIQANRDHQHALQLYAERLEAELNAADRMIVSLFIVHLCFTEHIPPRQL